MAKTEGKWEGNCGNAMTHHANRVQQTTHHRNCRNQETDEARVRKAACIRDNRNRPQHPKSKQRPAGKAGHNTNTLLQEEEGASVVTRREDEDGKASIL